MDGGFAEHYAAFDGEEEDQYPEEQTHRHFSSDRGVESFNNEDDSAGNDMGNGHHHHHNRDSSTGKLFVGGIAWDTTEEAFTNYFCKYGEITDSVIMMDKISGRPRGFGFVTFADAAVADKVLEEDHVINGRVVEVKRTVPREEMRVRGVQRTKKIFVGGLPPSLNEDELKEYFSFYGSVVEHQIMLDHDTGRSRGFGFVTFEYEDTVERIFSDGKTHELGGKRVEIKRAVPKRAGGDYASDIRMHRGGSGSKTYGSFNSGAAEYGAGYGGKVTRGYDRGYNAYGGYGGYGSYGGNYGGAAAAGFYGGYGGYGYGFGFWGPMYGGSGYGIPGGYGSGGAGYGGSKGYGSGSSKGYGSSGSGGGRYHPYPRK